jgi:uncharacterized protein
VAVPLLAFIMPVQMATPLAVLLSMTVAAIIVVQDWKQIHIRSAGWLTAPALIGIPLGVWLLSSGHSRAVKCGLGAVILLFSGYSLVGRKPPHLRHDRLAWLLGCGLLAGVLGGAYGIYGPPLIVYGAMRRWSAQHFRATLQAFFLPASILSLIGYAMSGLLVRAVTRDYLYSLPVAVPAVFLGRMVNSRLSSAAFLKYVYAGLAAIGALLLVGALAGKT